MKQNTTTIGLVTDILRQAMRLFQHEVELAKAEVSDGVTRGAVAAGMLLGAAVMAMIALNLLAGALVGFLVAGGMATGVATLLVAGLFAAGTGILYAVAVRMFRRASIVPRQAFHSVRRDAAMIKENARV
ncbi:putative superfamily III holin-X [Aliiruegeria haliotis]|uniref:Putative superfamily III holin-X n=1 Tax=Aliiruegeria haliotis TaxID=1280846 RepID=A0A2T0RLR5_9RHOB|nr:phage holin family protein [Aliiruegeria haliotis]PRY22135.1 putative superfamily III holin-X [Aliiruegeria haliotis]